MKNKKPATRNVTGFTLIELLVVVAVIAILMAILLPALTKARMQSQTVKCGSNLRQLGAIIQMYAADWNDIIMPINVENPADEAHPFDWTHRCPEYFNHKTTVANNVTKMPILRCPTAESQVQPRALNEVDYYRYGLNNEVCAINARNEPPTYIPQLPRKFSTLTRPLILAADSHIALTTSAGQTVWYFWKYIHYDSLDYRPWPHQKAVTGVSEPGFPGHNNSHGTNYLYTTFNVELRVTTPPSNDWNDGWFSTYK